MTDKLGKVAILGGTGLAGGPIINEALHQGYTVRALVRESSELQLTHRRLEVITGDAARGEDIEKLLQGCSAVLSAVGPAAQGDKDVDPQICSTATGHLIEKMSAANITRYILVSSAGLVMPADKRSGAYGLYSKFITPLLYGKLLKDKKREYRLLSASQLNWTIVRCPKIKQGKRLETLLANKITVPGGKVRTAELAQFIVAQLVESEFEREGVFVASV